MPEAKDLHDTTRQMIINVLRKEIDSSNVRGIYYVMYRMDNWDLNVKDWPEVGAWINHDKTRIIKELLVNLRQGGSGIGSTDFTINRLHKIGIRWPELDTIKKSIDADTAISEDESHDEQNAVRNARRLSSKLEGVRKLLNASVTLYDGEIRSMLTDAMYIMEGLKTKYADLVTPVLEHHKDTLIKSLLIMIREKGIGYWAVWEIISKLHNFSVSWPELRAIDKSIDAHNDESVRRQKDQWNRGEEVDEAMSDSDMVRENDDEDEARLEEKRREIIEEVLDAMTNGGSARTFREARNAMQTLDTDGEDMLADEMRRQKSSIIANLIDLFFTAEHRVVDALMLLIEYSPTNIPELSRLPDSILPAVEKEFDEKSHMQGLAKTLEDVDALVENGFNRDHLMTDVREYKLAGFVRNYAVNPFARTDDLGADLSAMLEMGVDKDELLPGVEKRKTTLIKAMLVSMKTRNYREVNVLLSALSDLGVQWTELAAIRKSLGSLHTLGEADGSKPHPIVNMVADKMKASIDRGDDHGVGYAIQVLSRVDPQQVYDGLKRIAPDLARWFDKMVKSSPSFALDELLKITYYMDGIYPELQHALDVHKDDVLKVLLSRLRQEGNERRVLRTVRYLADQGVGWKEFGVITRSLTSGDGLKEGWFGKKKNEQRQRDLETYGSLWDEDPFSAAYRMIEDETSLGFWPELRDKVNSWKDDVIKHLLTDIRRNVSLQMAKAHANALVDVGVDWPELMTIHKSLNSVPDEDEDEIEWLNNLP